MSEVNFPTASSDTHEMLQKINRNSGQIHMLLSSFVKSNESDLFFKEIWVFMIAITMHFLHFLNRRKLDVVLLIVNYKIICYALWKCSYFMKILIYRTVLYVYIFGAWFCIQWRLVISICVCLSHSDILSLVLGVFWWFSL